MRWWAVDLFSATAFGVAYTCVYYLTKIRGFSSLMCGAIAKMLGALLISCWLAYTIFFNSKGQEATNEMKRAAVNPYVMGVIFACSLMWFAAEIFLYEAQSIAAQPAYATAIWNMAPLPVFLLSLYYSKASAIPSQYVGIACMLLAVFVINI